MAEYYVIRDKNTGLYFRGKGVNRWGKHYNQASIYRVKGSAEHVIKEISWHGEQAEIVPIQIVETSADVVPESEVERLEHILNCYALQYGTVADKQKVIDKAKSEVAREIFEEIESISSDFPVYGNINTVILSERDLAFIKKKYTEDHNNEN